MATEKIIEITDGVRAEKDGDALKITGPRGEVKRNFVHPRVKITVNSNIVIKSDSEGKADRAVINTWAAHMRNMMDGVTNGYKYILKIVYSHFPMTIELKGRVIELKNFLGGRGIRTARILGDTEVEIQKEEIIVSGINKEDAGQTAANIEQMCSDTGGKDIRVFHDGLYISSKGVRND